MLRRSTIRRRSSWNLYHQSPKIPTKIKYPVIGQSRKPKTQVRNTQSIKTIGYGVKSIPDRSNFPGLTLHREKIVGNKNRIPKIYLNVPRVKFPLNGDYRGIKVVYHPKGWGSRVTRAISEAYGVEPTILHRPYRFDPSEFDGYLVVFWGIIRGSDRLYHDLKKYGIDFIHIDHAYFNRGHTVPDPVYRVSYNSTELSHILDVDETRRKHFGVTCHPWKTNRKGHIQLLVQSEAALAFHGVPDWCETMMKTLRKYTTREIRVSHKPGGFKVKNVDGVLDIYNVHPKITKENRRHGNERRKLEDDINGAFIVVTHKSNAAVESIRLGYPVLCHPECAASPVAITDPSQVEKPIYPPYRNRWVDSLCHVQWHMSEILSGEAINWIIENWNRKLNLHRNP